MANLDFRLLALFLWITFVLANLSTILTMPGYKAEATAMYPGIVKMVDKLAKTNVIHKNKANNLKSKLAIYINKLA